MLNIFDFVSDSRMFKKFKVHDLLFVEFKCLIKETEVGYWTHNNYFIYVIGGKKKWKTREKEYVLEDGEALFIKKGAYAAHQFFDEEFCALIIFVPDEFIKNVLHKFMMGKTIKEKELAESEPIVEINMDESLTGYFYSLFSYFPQSISPSEKLLSIKFEELIINIITSSNNRELADYFWKIHGRSKISIRDVMENYFNYNMNLKEYARLCGRSISTFKTEFYNTYNTTPGKWLIKKRLDYGKFLLETTDKSITDIAYESGFKNHSHFTRTFKEIYNKPPMKFKSV
ncbi:MAG: AraC family transcriptional regulator [Melioribacteraceae bacterium]|nr:AraC family transcriptional regulator [Melioribacteraceae bacterium]